MPDDPTATPLSPTDQATLAAGQSAWVDDRGVIPVEQVGRNPGQDAIVETPFQLDR